MPFAFPFRSPVLAWAATAGDRRGIAPNPGMSSEVATDSGDNRAKNDGRLLLRMAGGDRDALAELYDRFSRPLYATALRILHDPGEAQDVVHDVFISLWEKSALFATERGSAFSWAVTLTRNRSIDRLRSRRRRTGLLEHSVPADLGYEQNPPGSGAAEQAALGDQAQVVRTAVAALPDEQKLALEMAFFGGLTQQEIAQRLNQPLGTVKARIRRGLLKLRDSLGRHL